MGIIIFLIVVLVARASDAAMIWDSQEITTFKDFVDGVVKSISTEDNCVHVVITDLDGVINDAGMLREDITREEFLRLKKIAEEKNNVYFTYATARPNSPEGKTFHEKTLRDLDPSVDLEAIFGEKLPKLIPKFEPRTCKPEPSTDADDDHCPVWIYGGIITNYDNNKGPYIAQLFEAIKVALPEKGKQFCIHYVDDLVEVIDSVVDSMSARDDVKYLNTYKMNPLPNFNQNCSFVDNDLITSEQAIILAGELLQVLMNQSIFEGEELNLLDTFESDEDEGDREEPELKKRKLNELVVPETF